MSLVLPSSTLSLPSRAARQPDVATPAQGASASAVESAEILRGQKAVEINHNGLIYRLQATRLGKLILTK